MAQDLARDQRWAAAIAKMRVEREADIAERGWHYPAHGYASGHAMSDEAMERIWFHMAPSSLEVTLRYSEPQHGPPDYSKALALCVNRKDWGPYLAAFQVNQEWREGLSMAFGEACRNKKVTIVLDTRNSERSRYDQPNADWYNIDSLSQPMGINKFVPEGLLGVIPSVTLVSPYIVRSVVKVLTVTISRPEKGYGADFFGGVGWERLQGLEIAELNTVFQGILAKIRYGCSDGDDFSLESFGKEWASKHLVYFHDCIANIATLNVIPGQEELPRPATMGAVMRRWKEMEEQKAETERRVQAQKLIVERLAGRY